MPQKRLYKYFLVLQILLGQYCYGQSKDTLFEKFRNDILIEQQEHDGRVVWDDETRETYYSLLLTHSIAVLAKYTDDSIPAVRAEIFSGLMLKKADGHILEGIMNRHLNDSAEFTSSPTDVVITWTVGKYMQFLTSRKSESNLPEFDFKARLEKIKRERYIVIAGAHHGIILKDSLLKLDSLTYLPEWMKITSFTLDTRKKRMTSNNVLTERMKRHIRKLHSGDVIFFDKIKAQGPDKIIRDLSAIKLKIK